MTNSKVATAATVFVQEELTNSRRHCEALKRCLVKSLQLINSSEKVDHFYAVAGDLIYAAPQHLAELEKSLNATALAVNKLDYEELRQVIHPDKVDELEAVLDEVRIHIPRRI